jgi:hypothetical protein
MEYWEFLIQKEGDRSWLPLETADVEILEGRYRLVARSSRINVPVEIRITYQTPPEEFPPKRGVQKRTNRTSPEGLMVVIPFMRFKPGIWELRCVGDVNPDSQEETWQESVRLQVLPIDDYVDTEEDFAPGQNLTKQPPTVLAESAATPATEQHDQHDQNYQTSDRPDAALTSSPEDTFSDPNPDPETSHPSGKAPTPQFTKFLAAPAVKLTLAQPTFVVNCGERFTLSGRIEADTTLPGQFVVTGQLHIGLRSPENGKWLAQVQQPLLAQKLPVPFSCDVDIPLNCNTSLLLGEVNLYAPAESTSPDTPVTLASASFSITADVNQLMAEISDDLINEEILEFSRESAIKHNLTSIDETFLNIVETLKNPEPISFQRVKKPAIPPKIDLPTPTEQTSPFKAIEFPVFSRQPQFTPKNQQPPENPANSPESIAETPLPEETTAEATNVIDFTKKIQQKAKQKARSFESFPSDEVETAPELSIPEPRKPSVLETAFQKLNLQQRFLSRLNALASDGDLSQLLKSHFSELEIPKSLETEANAADPVEYEPEEEEIPWEDREIVVDDELETEATSVRQFLAGKNADLASAGLVLPEDEPVPNPHLEVPPGELIAGRPVKLVVRLPELEPRIYVKLWLHDRQTRTLLDGPHWITDFWATGMGDMEATMQLLIPYGTVEIELDAIAVEMQTERESHKVTLSCPVAPPTPPSLPLDHH